MSRPSPRKQFLNSPRLSAAQRSNLWPITAWGYAAWRSRSLSLLAGVPFSLEREARLFLGRCAPAPAERWLDAGTSAGFYAGVLAGAGCRVLAADLSPAMLRVAAGRHPSDLLIEWALLNLEASGLPDGAFDGVTVGATLNETHDPARLLRELGRLLRPGGQLWLMYVPRSGGPGQRLLSWAGLTFPDAAWVARQLPGFTRTDLLRVGAVQFERYVRPGPGGAVHAGSPAQATSL